MLRRILGAALLAALVSPLHAQTPSGEISGVVTDISGSVLPAVKITLTNIATNATREVETNDAGQYVLPALPPGVYVLKAERQGFRTVERANIEVLVGSANRIPVSMDVGQLTDVVEVTGGTPVLQTESAAIGTVIENRAIVELPLNGRNYLQLASLTPGATTNGPSSSQGKQRMGGQRNSFALNVGGQRVHYNHYSLDGVENTDLNFNSYMLLPSVDALQEFKIEAGLFDAEYGRAIAQINATTKSGTNRFHGTVFQFIRDSALDAKNYFDPKDRDIPPFTRKQYGLTVDGPVVLPGYDGRNKLFFMFNWEGLRERKSLTATPSLPLSAWRNGDFSGLRDASGNLIPDLRPGDRGCSTPPATCCRRRRRFRATSSRPTASIPCRAGCCRSTRRRTRSGPARTSPTTRRAAWTRISSPTASISSRARSRAGSSARASPASSATIRSPSPAWGSTRIPT